MNITNEQLSAYLDGALTLTEKAEVDRALAKSPKLRQELAELKQLGTLLKSVPAPTPPAGFYHLRQIKSKPRPRAWLPWTFPLLGAATAALVMVYVARDSKLSFHSSQIKMQSVRSADFAIPERANEESDAALEDRKDAGPQLKAIGKFYQEQPYPPTPTIGSKKELDFSGGTTSGSPATRSPSLQRESGQTLRGASRQEGAGISGFNAESLEKTKTLASAPAGREPTVSPQTSHSFEKENGAPGADFNDPERNKILVPQAPLAGKKIRKSEAAEMKPSQRQKAGSPSQEWQGDSSGIEDYREIVIRDAGAWAKLWNEHQSNMGFPSPVPAVNFKDSMVVGIFLGERGSSGFNVQMTETIVTKDEVVILHIETSAASGMMQLTVMTQPYHLKIIPHTNLPVRFKKQTAR
ncbi:MAG: hypothetical protein IPN90_10755 [Elusimicrobia bacterium]|nr:hypothetical protein [Elusimicrobiota bacterium]